MFKNCFPKILSFMG